MRINPPMLALVQSSNGIFTWPEAVTLVFRQLEVRFLASSMAGSPNHRKHLLKPPLPKQDTGSPRRQILSDSGINVGNRTWDAWKVGIGEEAEIGAQISDRPDASHYTLSCRSSSTPKVVFRERVKPTIYSDGITNLRVSTASSHDRPSTRKCS